MNQKPDTKYPLLFSVDSPADLRKLPGDRLPELAEQLRSYIIDVVSAKQGHLGSNLGVVELTVALHYVFDTPDDILVWDVGHQCYAHKILTGRREAFLHLRERGGLSGFPFRQESPYDAFGTGHSSTSISAALGMALADAAQGRAHRSHVAVIGDASIACGMAFEALNHAGGLDDVDLLVVLNDNAIGIDPVSGALEKHLRALLGQAEPPEGNLFRALHLKYARVRDGHDLPQLVAALREMKNTPGVKLLHVPTVKGKGFPWAEAEQILYHYPGAFDRTTGLRTQNPRVRYQDIVGQELLRIARSDDAVYVLTPAMPTSSGLAEMAGQMPRRVIDTGIAESHTLALAAGMACRGAKPFAVVYSTFLQRAYDQLVHDVALQNLPVRILADRAGVVGADGPTHHGVFDLAYLSSLPNMAVVAPSDGRQLRAALRLAARYDRGPLAVRYPRGEAEADGEPEEEMRFARGRCLIPASQVAVISVGAMLSQARQAIESFDPQRRRQLGLYDLCFVKPLDEDLLREVFSRCQAVITVEDGVRSGGAGSAVALWAQDNGFSRVPVTVLGIPDRFLPCGTREQLYHDCGLDAEGIARRIEAVLETVG